MSLEQGDQLPEFTAIDQNGEEFNSNTLQGRAAVIYFYPKDETPGCTREACMFRDHFEEFTQAGATVVGISGDSPKSHKKFAEKHRLPFTLLTDKKRQLEKLFGVSRSVLGLLPGRETFIFDKNGKLKRRFNSQFNINSHISEALESIQN
jgi:peroxiredoxin Q/BCP